MRQHTHRHCEFCRHIETQDDLLWVSDHVVVRLGRPHHKGHTEVIFARHEEDLTALTDAERDAFFDEMILVASAVKRVLKPDTINYQMLGNWIPHLHWHIYPRFREDPDFGNPMEIPLRDEVFEPRLPSAGQIEALVEELDRSEVGHCPHCRRRKRRARG